MKTDCEREKRQAEYDRKLAEYLADPMREIERRFDKRHQEWAALTDEQKMELFRAVGEKCEPGKAGETYLAQLPPEDREYFSYKFRDPLALSVAMRAAGYMHPNVRIQ